MMVEIQLIVELQLKEVYLRLNSIVYHEKRSDPSIKTQKNQFRVFFLLKGILQKVVEQIAHLLIMNLFHVVIKYIVLIIEHTKNKSKY